MTALKEWLLTFLSAEGTEIVLVFLVLFGAVTLYRLISYPVRR